MRNPKWHRDEIILALELYFRTKPGHIHARNPEIIELSEVLNKLPIHIERPDQTKFRNPNGVGLKLSNFLAIDPNYHGKGMEAYSKLDKEVFEEYKNYRSRLSLIAKTIKKAVQTTNLRNRLYQIEDDEDEFNIVVREGKVIYKLHKYFERNHKINKKKKEFHLRRFHQLKCEVCGFDFYEKYGELGKGYIECHHIRPFHEICVEMSTSLKDLALVCANCHRMLHRNLNSLSVEDLKNKLNKR